MQKIALDHAAVRLRSKKLIRPAGKEGSVLTLTRVALASQEINVPHSMSGLWSDQ